MLKREEHRYCHPFLLCQLTQSVNVSGKCQALRQTYPAELRGYGCAISGAVAIDEMAPVLVYRVTQQVVQQLACTLHVRACRS